MIKRKGRRVFPTSQKKTFAFSADSAAPLRLELDFHQDSSWPQPTPIDRMTAIPYSFTRI
jgi:hypothetical protein